ncbi:MAG TPA: methyltransferase domain-containing protein [Cyclobacteriaceae bacterium]|nr:methyltransferase domain-containing protein [Cyclobacteriaceae bacterium]
MFPYFMTVKEHYERYLGNFYSWMAGDFAEKQQEQEYFFRNSNIEPNFSGVAIDLGCGHGLQAVSLANIGFSVHAVDFNPQLLSELKKKIGTRDIAFTEAHLLEYLYAIRLKPELIVCMGDTLTHLSGQDQVEELISLSAQKLEKGGKLILSYRELATELTNERRFIPVKSDEHRIHMCYLEYLPGYVKVFDVLYELESDGWKQHVSWYPKLRIPVSLIISLFEKHNLRLLKQEVISGMTYLIAGK